MVVFGCNSSVKLAAEVDFKCGITTVKENNVNLYFLLHFLSLNTDKTSKLLIVG